MYYTLLFEAIRYGTLAYTYASKWIRTFVYGGENDLAIYEHENGITLTEATNEEGETRTIISYRGKASDIHPFELPPPKLPWIWVGNPDTEDDWTASFQRYIVVGNRITSTFVKHITDGQRLVYMDASFNQKEFDEEGVIIEADVS